MPRSIAPYPRNLLSSIFILLLGNGAFAAVASPRTISQDICQHLEEMLGTATTRPNEEYYEDLRTENWVETAWGEPTCIFQPHQVDELQSTIPLLVEANVSFAIRSGGHSPHHGFANTDGGVLIDMANFNQLKYDQENEVTTVGSGLTWGEVYTHLEQYQQVVVGGRVMDVGVGGSTLGSGLSWHTDLYGLACDNVVNFEVVLADGSLVHSNANENSDLFWALKGGSNNFGIVTEFTLKTYPQGQIWGGIRKYTIEDLPAIMNAYYEYQKNADKDPYANLIMLASPTNSTIGVWVSMIYLKSEEDPAAFASFNSINATEDSTATKSFTEYLAEYGVPAFSRLDWHTTTLKKSESLHDEVTNIIMTSTAVDIMKSVPGGFMAATIQPISASVAERGKVRSEGNALGLEAVDQTWLAFSTAWLWPEDDTKVHTIGDGILGEVNAAAEAGGNRLPFLFMNDASWSQDVIASYGEENVQRLRKVQKHYDPDLVFQRLVPRGFKL